MLTKIPPELQYASYNEARDLARRGAVTGDDLRAWFPVWRVGKCEYAVVDGRPCERQGTEWVPIAWIENHGR